MSFLYNELRRSVKKTGLEIVFEYWDTKTPEDINISNVIFPPKVIPNETSILGRIETRLAGIERKLNETPEELDYDIEELKVALMAKGKMNSEQTFRDYVDELSI